MRENKIFFMNHYTLVAGQASCVYVVNFPDKAVGWNECSGKGNDQELQLGACAPRSDHGGGMFVSLGDRYYLRGVLDPGFPGLPLDTCRYHIYNDIGRFIPFLKRHLNK